MTSASTWAAVIASRSAATRAGRRSGIGGDRKLLHQSAQRQLVTVRSKTADDGDCGIREGGVSSFRLTREDVGEMDFDEGNLHASESVANRETRVAVSTGVHQRAIRTTAQRVNRLDDFPLPVVLREREL